MEAFKGTTLFLSDKIVGGAPAANTNTSTGQATNQGGALPAPSSGPMSWISTVLLYGAMLAALYFFMLRPQRKRDKDAKAMQSGLKVGDSIVTSSGMFGKIATIGQDSMCVEFGENRGVRIWVRKSDVVGVKSPVMTPPPVIEDTAKK